MSKMKRNREANKISAYREQKKYDFKTKHGNHLFQNNKGTGNPMEKPHFQGKMKGSKLL